MTSPIPGVTYPDPRTWIALDPVTACRLRADATNLGAFFMGARPLMVAYNTGTSTLTGGTRIFLPPVNYQINSWNVEVSLLGWTPPLAGWYLVQGTVLIDSAGSSQDGYKYAAGTAVYDSATLTNTFTDGGALGAWDVVSGSVPGPVACDLVQVNPSLNAINVYGYTDNTADVVLSGQIIVEWVAMPDTTLTDWSGPYGTLVSSPASAAQPPYGSPYSVQSAVAAGATSVTLNGVVGIVTGTTIGLDWYSNGQLAQPYAEEVTVEGIAGDVLTISATQYAHAQGAPVAVPLSAAWMNQQVRDATNFLAYPPVCRMAAETATQSIPSTSSFPTVTGNPSNQVTGMTTVAPDNFSGSASGAEYIIPLSGTYFVWGQVYFGGAAVSGYNFAAGVSANGSTITWGTVSTSTSNTGESYCATVSGVGRYVTGESLTLWAFQNSGSAMSTAAAQVTNSRLIVVWRSF